MQKSEIIPRRIFHPKCANCGTQMWLAQIEPDTPDHQQRTFECSKCGHQDCESIARQKRNPQTKPTNVSVRYVNCVTQSAQFLESRQQNPD
jgi:DNA-directed RNA polymerase subunit RPC12/RpoP